MGFNTPIPESLTEESRKVARILRSFTIPNAKTGPDKVIPPTIIENAKGVAVLTVFKAGFLVTMRAGSGLVVARLPNGSWSAPSAIGLVGLGGGFEIGAELTDFVIILNTQSAVDAFSKGGNVTLGANLSVAAGPIGRNMEAAAAVRSFSAVYTYSKTRGLFAGISLEGSGVVERKEANAKFYGERIRAREILTGVVRPPADLYDLYSALDAHNADAFAKVGYGMTMASDYGGRDLGVPMAAMARAESAYKRDSGKKETPPSSQGGSARASNEDSGRGHLMTNEPIRVRASSGASSYSQAHALAKPPPRSSGRDIGAAPSILTKKAEAPAVNLLPAAGAASAWGSSHATPSYGSASYSAPSYTNQSYSAPSYSSPAPAYSAPSYTAPAYSASPAPAYEPPAPQQLKARALYDFSGQEACDLSFRAGDEIVVTERTGDTYDWWEGEQAGRKGIFPANFVELIAH
eukprot:Colp12_sorted_trinity150504_noHs@34476